MIAADWGEVVLIDHKQIRTESFCICKEIVEKLVAFVQYFEIAFDESYSNTIYHVSCVSQKTWATNPCSKPTDCDPTEIKRKV